MKKLFITLLFLISISPIVFAQSVDGQFVILINDGNTYSIKVQIKLQSGSQNLGNTTIRFSFNQTNLSFPQSPVDGIDYIFHNFQGGDYSSSTVSNPSSNNVSINIAFITGSGTTVTTDYIDVATINFTTLIPAGNANLQWGTRELFPTSGSTPWVVGNWPNLDTSPLPVELSSFTASANQNYVNLKWQTATEVNNYGFEVERSIMTSEEGNLSWKKVGFVNGNGNSNTPKTYSFQDKNLSGGSKLQYRLKQIDNDGKFDYSNVVDIELIPTKFELSQNYPNPFNPSTKIFYTLPADSKVSVKVYDILGNLVETLVDEQKEAGYYDIIFNAKKLSSGVYIYSISTENFNQSKKMILIK